MIFEASLSNPNNPDTVRTRASEIKPFSASLLVYSSLITWVRAVRWSGEASEEFGLVIGIPALLTSGTTPQCLKGDRP